MALGEAVVAAWLHSSAPNRPPRVSGWMGRSLTLSSRRWPVFMLGEQHEIPLVSRRGGMGRQHNATALLPFPHLLPWCCAPLPLSDPALWHTRQRKLVLKMETNQRNHWAAAQALPMVPPHWPLRGSSWQGHWPGGTHSFLPLLRSLQGKLTTPGGRGHLPDSSTRRPLPLPTDNDSRWYFLHNFYFKLQRMLHTLMNLNRSARDRGWQSKQSQEFNCASLKKKITAQLLTNIKHCNSLTDHAFNKVNLFANRDKTFSKCFWAPVGSSL